MRAVSPNGVLGDPSEATCTEGARLLAALSQDLAAAFDRWSAALTGPPGAAELETEGTAR